MSPPDDIVAAEMVQALCETIILDLGQSGPTAPGVAACVTAAVVLAVSTGKLVSPAAVVALVTTIAESVADDLFEVDR